MYLTSTAQVLLIARPLIVCLSVCLSFRLPAYLSS